MKGRSLRNDHHSTGSPTGPPGAGAPARVSGRVATRVPTRGAIVPLAGALAMLTLAACGGGSGPTAAAAALPGATDTTVESVDDPMLVVPSTAPTTTTVRTTVETTPATSAAPTVVETLPVPDAPPPPRADEPYVELGRIQIPKIGIDTTLLQGISLNTLDLGPGHWPGTALPGQVGNTVIAGHRTSHNKVFRNVDQLVPGDEVIFTTAEGDFVYVVSETTIVKPDAMYIIDQTFERTATLFACHPPGSTRERIVVHLDLASSPGGTVPADDPSPTTVAPSI